MSGEDQERFEDYLELEQFISELQAGHAAHLPQELTPTQARVYRLATLFHAATPGVSEPDAAFAEELQVKLETALKSPNKAPHLPITTTPSQVTAKPQRQRVSRRLLIAGGAVA